MKHKKSGSKSRNGGSSDQSPSLGLILMLGSLLSIVTASDLAEKSDESRRSPASIRGPVLHAVPGEGRPLAPAAAYDDQKAKGTKRESGKTSKKDGARISAPPAARSAP